MRLVALLCLLIAAPVFAAPQVAIDTAERERRLAVIFAGESRSFFCGTPLGKRVWAPIVPVDQLLAAAGSRANQQAIANDLYNWVPMDAACASRRDSAGAAYLPDEAWRGDVARVWFYFEREQGVAIDAASRARFLEWDIADPVDEAEAARTALVAVAQGGDLTAPRIPLSSWRASLRQALATRYADNSRSMIDYAREHFAKHEYSSAYFSLDWVIQEELEQATQDVLDGKSAGWDRAFGLLEFHDLATRASRPRIPLGSDTLAAKMLSLAIASGNDSMSAWHAEWLSALSRRNSWEDDGAYPAFILQMADIARARRWPRVDELRKELGPYRGLFQRQPDSRQWRDAVVSAVNAYLDGDDISGHRPRLFAVEFAALRVLRDKYSGQPSSSDVHALQRLPTLRVPPYRTGSLPPRLEDLRRRFAAIPASPALHRAIVANDPTALRAAITPASVNQVDALGATPLLLAVEWHRDAMIGPLRRAGAHWVSADGERLLQAAAGGQRDTVSLMLAAGADPNYTRDGYENDTPLSSALKSQVDALTLVKLLVAGGARPKSADQWAEVTTKLAGAVDLQTFRELLAELQRAGLDPRKVDVLCALNTWQDLDTRRLEMALAIGAPIDGVTDGLPPIFCAIEEGLIHRVRWFVEHGARLDIKDSQGMTPAQYADDIGKQLIARYLREARTASKK